jgi:hypothetical protein
MVSAEVIRLPSMGAHASLRPPHGEVARKRQLLTEVAECPSDGREGGAGTRSPRPQRHDARSSLEDGSPCSTTTLLTPEV